MFSLSKVFFSAIDRKNMIPLLGQRAVCCDSTAVGTAVDVVCYDSQNNCLVLVEIKCGFSGDKNAAAVVGGKIQHMSDPLGKVRDTVLNRHMAQTACNHALFRSEPKLMLSLRNMGLNNTTSLLVYLSTNGAEIYDLPTWWQKRGAAIVKKL